MPGKKNAPAPAVPLQPMPRVKVFCLNDERGWDDFGGGHVTIDYLEGSTEEVVLAVIDTANDEKFFCTSSHQITSTGSRKTHSSRGVILKPACDSP